jgi:hypothetical protein
VPGGAGCTPPQPSITALINFLIANPTSFTGNGAIYFQTGDYTGTETYIRIDYAVLPQLGTISVFGGWDLDPAGGYSGNTGTTTFDVPVEVVWDTDVTLADITVDFSGTPSEGSEVGVFVSTGGDVTLDNVDVQGGSYGVYIDNSGGSGNVTVRGVPGDNSVFSGNTNYGLMIYSSGSVTLAYVTASGNLTGIYIDNSNGTAGVNAGNIFVDGNSWTGIDIRSIGDIILDAVTESGSTVGANLQSTAGIGNIFVSNSTFTGNSSVGIRAVTNEGDISLTIVTTDNSDTPGSFGAWLKSYGGGTITVTDSTFNNADTGLFIVGTGNVFLNNVTADSNLGDGAVVESGWVFGCFGPDGIAVTITDGSYQDNGGYGFVVYPGPKGSVTLAGTIAMQGNTAGENNIDLIRTCVPVEEKPAKPYQVVEVTGRGDDPVQPDCELYSGALLILPDQSRVKVACPVEEPITVAEVAKDKLPGDPPKSFVVIAGLVVTAGESDLLPTGSWMQLCFKIPDGMEGKHFAILYWDTAANGGAGGWIEMPMNQFGGQVFSLHPDTPEDGMKILEGVYQKGNSICVKVNFTGTFILVAR